MGTLQWPARIESFRQAREAGYIEGQNVDVEYRVAEGRAERYRDWRRSLLRQGGRHRDRREHPPYWRPSVQLQRFPSCRRQRRPGGVDLSPIYARPGGNITGRRHSISSSGAKRLELFEEVVPSLSRVAVLGSVKSAAVAQLWKRLQPRGPKTSVARRLGSAEQWRSGRGIRRRSKRTCRWRASRLSSPLLGARRRCGRAGDAQISGVLSVPHFARAGGLSLTGQSIRPVWAAAACVGRRFSRAQNRQFAGRATDQIRADRQPKGCQGARA